MTVLPIGMLLLLHHINHGISTVVENEIEVFMLHGIGIKYAIKYLSKLDSSLRFTLIEQPTVR